MDRRSFLKTILGVAVGTIVPTPALATSFGSNRYQRVITAQLRTIAATKAWEAAGGDYYHRQDQSAKGFINNPAPLVPHYQRVVNETETLIGILNAEFASAPADIDDAWFHIQCILNNHLTIDTLSEASLREIEDAVVNVAVARAMLQHHRVPINGLHMKQWNGFVDRIKPILWHSPSHVALARYREVSDAHFAAQKRAA